VSRTRILLTQDDPSAVGWLHGLPNVGSTIAVEAPIRLPFRQPRGGRATGFGATDGIATTDLIHYNMRPMSGFYCVTVAYWAYARSQGGGGFGRVLVGGDEWYAHVGSGTGDKWGFSRRYSVTDCATDSATAVATNAWVNVCSTNDLNLAYNAPFTRFWINGVLDAAGGPTTPSGTPNLTTTTTVNAQLGNRESDSARCFDGKLAHVAVWNRVLTAQEIRRQMKRGPMSVPNGLAFYDPLDGGAALVGVSRRAISGTKWHAIPVVASLPVASRARFYDLAAITTPALDHWFPLSTATTDGLFLKLQIGGSAPGTSMLGTGWHVDATAANQYSRMAKGVVRLASTFSGTAQPSGGPDSSLGDGWRTEHQWTVSKPAGTWTFPIPFIASAAGEEGAQAAVCLRMWVSDNADGSTPTEITSGATVGTTVTDLQSEAEQVSLVTISLGAVSFTAKYIFLQVALKVV